VSFALKEEYYCWIPVQPSIHWRSEIERQQDQSLVSAKEFSFIVPA